MDWYSLPNLIIASVVSIAIGIYLAKRDHKAKSGDAPSSEPVEMSNHNSVIKPTVTHISEPIISSHCYGDNQYNLDKFKYETFTYAGVLDIGVDNLKDLPDMIGNENKKLVYSGNCVLLLWSDDAWLALSAGFDGTHGDLYTLKCLKNTVHFSFRAVSFTEKEKELEARLHDWVYAYGPSVYRTEGENNGIGSAILLSHYGEQLDSVNSMFKNNLTLAPTSAIIKMSEDFLSSSVHDRWVVMVREELAKRVATLKDIEEAKKILYG